MDGEPNNPADRSSEPTDRPRSVNPIARAFHRLSDLAIVSGCYTAGGVVVAYELVGEPTEWSVVAAAGLCAVGLYLIDRVKLRNRDLDPADLAAMPERHAFLRRHAVLIRLASVALFAVSSVLFGRHHPWLSAMPPLGLVSVVVYSLGPRHGRRPKDQLLLKNAIVASAVVTLAAAVLWASGVDLLATPSLAAFAWLGLIVFGDAALSDLDDTRTDRQYDTHTLPNTMGPPLTWGIAIAAQVVGGAVLLSIGERDWAAWFLGLGVPFTTAGLWLVRPNRVRDPIDLRLPLLAAAALLLQHA